MSVYECFLSYAAAQSSLVDREPSATSSTLIVELPDGSRLQHCAAAAGAKSSKTRLPVDIGSIRSRDIVRRVGHLARPRPQKLREWWRARSRRAPARD